MSPTPARPAAAQHATRSQSFCAAWAVRASASRTTSSARAVLLAFKHRGRAIQFEASAKGWAAWFLRETPWTHRMRKTRQQHEAAALEQGMIAVNSILRDWCKGQVTAVECGLMPVEPPCSSLTWSRTTAHGDPAIGRNELLPPPSAS